MPALPDGAADHGHAGHEQGEGVSPCSCRAANEDEWDGVAIRAGS